MNDERVKAIAFYLPQYHPIRENSEWWGPGFTEWTNVARAQPNFEGHYQPHIPRDLGFYDLRLLETMRQQAELAAAHGLYGFCFYYYRFQGRRVLELPLNQYLSSDISFPFCYCWANENWTRTWDGLEKAVLLKQEYSHEDDIQFLRELVPVFKDPRYIKVDGKPMLLVYRPTLFPDSRRTAATWRREAEAAGFPGLHLCTVQFYGIDDPRDLGFDAAVEFPPHKLIGRQTFPDDHPRFTNRRFAGDVIDYRKAMARAINRGPTPYTWYRGVMPSWDNTPRRQNSSHIFVNASPRFYRFWLQYLVEFTKRHNPPEHRYIFINAWNEWGEGAHLEPDLKYGCEYLEHTLKALSEKKLDLTEYITGDTLLRFLLDNLAEPEQQIVQRSFNFNHHVGPHAKDVGQRYRELLRDKAPFLYNALRRVYLNFR